MVLLRLRTGRAFGTLNVKIAPTSLPHLEELVSFAEFCNDQRMMLGDLELSQKLKAWQSRS